MSERLIEKGGEIDGQRLIDQYITVRILTRILMVLVVVASGAWWFLFDEVRGISKATSEARDDLRTEMLFAIEQSDNFQVEQRIRLWDRVNEVQREVQELQGQVRGLEAGVEHIARTTDAIFSVVTRTPPADGPAE